MRWGLVVAFACACNQVHGIGQTSGPDSDRDGDGDGGDNCALVANGDQRDQDSDGIGDACDPCVQGEQLGTDGDGDGIDDACDPCLAGSNHDEDGDEHLDGCDVCPGASDDQADADGDGVGDACDHAPGLANTRVLFDGFAPPRPGWNTGFQPWSASGEGMTPVPPIEGNFTGAWHPDAGLAQVGWRIEVAVRVPPAEAGSSSDDVAVHALTVDGGYAGRVCALRTLQGAWTVAATGASIQIGEVVRLQVRERVSVHECWIDGVLVATGSHLGSQDQWWPVLDADVAAEFQWVDVVR